MCKKCARCSSPGYWIFLQVGDVVRLTQRVTRGEELQKQEVALAPVEEGLVLAHLFGSLAGQQIGKVPLRARKGCQRVPEACVEKRPWERVGVPTQGFEVVVSVLDFVQPLDDTIVAAVARRCDAAQELRLPRL